MNEFILLYRNTDEARQAAMGTAEKAQQSMQRWLDWMRELEQQGHLTEAGQPLDRGGNVVRGDSKSVIDGPYAETKDLIGGYSIVRAKDLAEATELAKGCPILSGGGSVEVRPVMKMNT